MILISEPTLKFLLRGREISVVMLVDKREWRRGRTYAAGVHHNKTICRVEIISIQRYNDGNDKVQLVVRHAQAGEAYRLLGKKGGYVTHASQALPDEPEAVDLITQTRYAHEGRARDAVRVAERRRAQRDRIADEILEMRSDLQDLPDRRVAKIVRGIESQLRSLDRTLDEAA